MKNVFKLILSLLLVVIMALSVVACDMDTDAADTTGETKKSTEDEKNATFSIDAAVKMNNKWKMTFKDCQVKNKLDSFTVAADGTEFVLVFFEIENISDESQNFNLMWEEFYIDGVKLPQTMYGALIDNSFQLTAVPVEPGRKANGYLLFQTSPGWKELEIIYDESLTDENEENVIKFILTQNAD